MRRDNERTLRLIRGRCDEIGECWIWRGSVGGYSKLPCMHHDGKTRYVRRVVYDLAHPEKGAASRVVTPKCVNPMCVSPLCLEAMPRKEALQRAGRRGSYSRPTKAINEALTQRAKSRISEETVVLIRSAESATAVSRATGVSLSYVKAIRRGVARKDYSNPFAGLFSGLLAANETGRRAA